MEYIYVLSLPTHSTQPLSHHYGNTGPVNELKISKINLPTTWEFVVDVLKLQAVDLQAHFSSFANDVPHLIHKSSWDERDIFLARC